jgi:hypothetical protein
LQTVPETFIGRMLEDPRFKGKADPDLTRLQQYRLLQARHESAPPAGADTSDFLRGSGIVVRLEHELEPHIDRAIELINRTNQLNYTKHRLSEDVPTAREQLRKMLAGYDRHFGILHVRDRYGDHGYCGLYILQLGAARRGLLQFCFSCRILNMGVETWLYRHLGRPNLNVRGEVLTDVLADGPPVDWITLEHGEALAIEAREPFAFNYVYARGGCELQAVMHYFKAMAANEFYDVNVVRDDRPLRLDHTVFVGHALNGLPEGALRDMEAVGFRKDDFVPWLRRLPDQQRALWVLSFWSDSVPSLYRHRATGALVPLRLRRNAQRAAAQDITRLVPDEFPDDAAMIQAARDAFDFVGAITQAQFHEHLEALFDRLPAGGRAFVLLGYEGSARGVPTNGRETPLMRVNRWTRAVAASFPAVTLLELGDFIEHAGEAENVMHFHREVYFRIFRRILADLASD